mgnify:CR=1 FL=1
MPNSEAFHAETSLNEQPTNPTLFITGGIFRIATLPALRHNGPGLPRDAWKGQYTQFPRPNQRICITIIGYWPGDLLFFAA